MFRSSQSPAARAMRRNAPREKVQREERIPVVKSAYITVDGSDPMLACTVRDINSGGARISVADIHKIADEFLLIARSEDLVARVRVAWRREKEIGVRFLRSTRLDNEERMRHEQAKVFERNRAAEAQRLAEAEAAQAALERQQQEAERMAQARQRFDRMVTLGMDPTQGYTKDMLRDAYHARAKETHPDQGGDSVTFDAVKLAYEGLLAEFPA